VEWRVSLPPASDFVADFTGIHASVVDRPETISMLVPVPQHRAHDPPARSQRPPRAPPV
jgi:hypothetical protein